MASNAAPAKSRSAYFDNLKYVLITLVVVGHMLNTWLSATDMDPSKETGQAFRFYSAMLFIYLFHMPAFLFTGGLFAKKMFTRERGLNVNMVAFYAVVYVIMYTGMHFERSLWTTPEYDLFFVSGVTWYMFAMAVLVASTALVANVKLGWKLVVPASFLFAFFINFSPYLGAFLSLGRIVNYAPFFFIGYFMDTHWIESRVVALRRLCWPVALAALVLAGIAAFIYLFVPYDICDAFMRTSFGSLPFPKITDLGVEVGVATWLARNLLAVLMTACVCLLVPVGKTFFTKGGTKTLQVYFLHSFVYYALGPLGLAKAFCNSDIRFQIVWVILSGIVLAWLLSLPDFPAKLFDKLRKAIRIQKE